MKKQEEIYYQKKWEEQNTYAYNSAEDRTNTFVIDTPPPTISGALHIGHVFSYTQTDILARFQRMQGKNVFYPMGWDNNGLPTERRVQNLYKITCDPVLSPTTEKVSVEEILKRKDKKILGFLPVSRKTFIHICSTQSKEDQKNYERLWRRLALSIDWTQSYETISPSVQALSQRSFLDLYKKGFVENRHTPVYWDTQFKTAIAQADMEDRKQRGFYHDIKFGVYNEGQSHFEQEFVISTTRPEMLPACVAVVAHPEDARYKNLFHKWAVTPLFSSLVPILPSTHADPTKGTGILMVCTFGDKEDAKFWEKHKLPLKQIISPEGFLKELGFLQSSAKSSAFKDSPSYQPAIKHEKSVLDLNWDSNKASVWTSLQPEKANQYYGELKGLRVKQARTRIRELLKDTKHLVSEPKPTEHSVKFYEKGDYPLEIIPARQWYIKLLAYKKEWLKQGLKIKWHPPAMRKRYEQWVEGLNQDWCLSRQRFFGVPFPVWYPLDKNKVPDYKNPILPIAPRGGDGRTPLADPSQQDCSLEQKTNRQKVDTAFVPAAPRGGDGRTAVDPMSSCPADWGAKWADYTEDKRGKAGGFIAEEAVMDTWATSSLTPQINSHWGLDTERHKKLFPADLRPQAHEIIRTWAFYTIVKAFFHGITNNSQEESTKSSAVPLEPWKHIVISGWVMDPQRLKMSKSKGGKGALGPEELMDKYSADAIRFWAGKARLGMDTVYDENMFKAGQKLTVKLNNAFKFVQIQIKGMEDFLNPTGRKPTDRGRKPTDRGRKPTDRGRKPTDKVPHCSIEHPSVLREGADFMSCKGPFISSVLDQAWMIYLCDIHRQATAGLKGFHYAEALDLIEKAFWLFCDNYIELVKGRAYQWTPQKVATAGSAVHTLDLSMYCFVKMLAPYLPYTTEHIWEQRYSRLNPTNSSVHLSQWEEGEAFLSSLKEKFAHNIKEVEGDKRSSSLLNLAFYLLENIRSYKASQKKSLSAPVREIKINMNKKDQAFFKFFREDLARASHVLPQNIHLNPSSSDTGMAVEVFLSTDSSEKT